jgi:two-component system, OmpR family, response regulator
MYDIKILLIDDDEKVKFNLKLFLEDEGFECLAVETAEIAVKQLDEINGGVDLAIVDIRLPGMSGEEFIPIMKDKYPGIKTIIHTGSTDYRCPAEFSKYNISDREVFLKPIKNLTKLVEKIYSLINE